MTRQTLQDVISDKSGISPEMAIRPSKGFGSAAEACLRMQLAYGLAQAREDESKIKVRPLREPRLLRVSNFEFPHQQSTGSPELFSQLQSLLELALQFVVAQVLLDEHEFLN